MSPTIPTWRVLRSQQEMARNNARQALLVIQKRRREQEESDRALPLAFAPDAPANPEAAAS